MSILVLAGETRIGVVPSRRCGGMSGLDLITRLTIVGEA